MTQDYRQEYLSDITYEQVEQTVEKFINRNCDYKSTNIKLLLTKLGYVNPKTKKKEKKEKKERIKYFYAKQNFDKNKKKRRFSR